MEKKGMQMSMQTIVVVVMLLIVLVVVIVIFSGRMGTSVKEADRIYKGVKCSDVSQEDKWSACSAKFSCGANEDRYWGVTQEKEKGQICCCTKVEPKEEPKTS